MGNSLWVRNIRKSRQVFLSLGMHEVGDNPWRECVCVLWWTDCHTKELPLKQMVTWLEKVSGSLHCSFHCPLLCFLVLIFLFLFFYFSNRRGASRNQCHRNTTRSESQTLMVWGCRNRALIGCDLSAWQVTCTFCMGPFFFAVINWWPTQSCGWQGNLTEWGSL